MLPFEWQEQIEWRNKLNTVVKAACFTLIHTPGSLNPFPLHSHFKYHTNNARRYPVGAFLASFFHSQPSELRQNQTEYLTLHTHAPQAPFNLFPLQMPHQQYQKYPVGIFLASFLNYNPQSPC